MNKREYDEMREKYKMPLTYEEMKEENKHYRHPDALSNFEATAIWLVVMVVGAIFNERIGIWIIATIIWLNYID